MMMVLYVASLVRSVIALHGLIDNREEKKAKELGVYNNDASKGKGVKEEKKAGDKAVENGGKEKK